MKYTILLWPHANARYRAEASRLAQAELGVMLPRLAPEARVTPEAEIDMPALSLETEAPLDDGALERLRSMSWLYGAFERRADGALVPLVGREPAYLGEDLPGILKYKGKTNEMFTQLLVNVALYAGDYWRGDERVRLLDPMCGRGTALFVGANRGWDCTGSDVDRADLHEAEKFLKRYLEYHRFKHAFARRSLTVRGAEGAPCAEFLFSDTPEHYKQKKLATLRLVELDAARVRDAFGSRAFHAVVCDLPYGVQHGARGGSLEALLARSLPGWRDALKPGGAVALSFNAQTLGIDRVRALMEAAGLTPRAGGAYDHFAHWVEQAVTRDVAVGRRER